MAEPEKELTAEQIAIALARTVLTATKLSVETVCAKEGCPPNSCSPVQVCTAAAIGALTVLAMCIAQCPERVCKDGECCHNPRNRVTPSSLFFAAQVVAHAVQDATKEGISSDVGVNTFAEAITAFKKLNDGANPETFLDPKLVAAIQKDALGSEEPLADFLAKFKLN